MSSKPTDDLKDFEKVRQREAMRSVSDRNADDASDVHENSPRDDFSGDDYWEDEIDLDDDPGAGIFKKLVPVGLGLIAVSIVGGGILIMLGDSSPKQNIPDAIPLIEAETTPEKTKPEAPGGMTIPHQDKLVLNKEGEGDKTVAVEKLLPPPEVPNPPKAEDVVAEAIEAESGVAEKADAQKSNIKKESVEKTITSDIVSEKIAEATEEDVANLTPPPAAPVAPEVESVLAPEKPVEIPKAAKVVKPKTTVAKKADVVTNTAKAVTPTSTKLVSGQYVLQLASLKSKDGAMTEWKNIQRKLSSLLGNKQPIIEKASITGVGVRYRLQTGPFADKKAASDFCAKLKSAKRDCLVKKVK
ncbi:hypothetical protein A9Q97_01120 [Rhodospirillales bacterium 47_12_T64]|nr:hypothetical protein A9Q97_01120 [Rhodospirillales bacterium 47_12_T64]